jgi:hypothetical protein
MARKATPRSGREKVDVKDLPATPEQAKSVKGGFVPQRRSLRYRGTRTRSSRARKD